MKTSGIIRRIDDLGRITIPKELRRAVGIKEGDALEIGRFGKALIIEKVNPLIAEPPKSKEQIATEWLQEHKTFISVKCARFVVDNDVTICEGFLNGRRVRGEAKRSPYDQMAPSIGMVYALCRAYGLEIPKGLE